MVTTQRRAQVAYHCYLYPTSVDYQFCIQETLNLLACAVRSKKKIHIYMGKIFHIVHQKNILLESLRQFCVNFRNGMVQSETLHMDNLIHRIIIWHHFWCWSYFRPQGVPGAQAYFSAIFNNVSLIHGYKWFHLLSIRPSRLFKCQALQEVGVKRRLNGVFLVLRKNA